jgi:hypothetical protein
MKQRLVRQAELEKRFWQERHVTADFGHNLDTEVARKFSI